MNTTNPSRSDYDKCRLCLANGDETDFIPIFNGNDDPGISLAVRIMVCLSLPVQARDSFPHNVCKNCENQLTRFYEFREICYNSYYSLSQDPILNNAKEKFSSDHKDNTRNVSCHRIKADTNEDANIFSTSLANTAGQESDECLEQDILFLQNIHTSSSDESTNDRATFNKAKMLAERLHTNVTNETISTNIILDEGLESIDCTQNEQTATKHCYDERTVEEIDFAEDAQSIVRYKCLACDSIFPDLSSASVHCTECSLMEQSETTEYLDETYNERTESLKVTKDKSLTSNKQINDTNDMQNRSTERSKIPDTHSTESSRAPRGKMSLTTSKKQTLEGISRHSCSNCESVFTSAALLRRHTVVHTGERPYECAICKKHFSQIGQLNFHKKFHENPRYRCNVCKKPFLRPSDIEKHMRTHTGEKPYSCKVCPKSFAQLVALQQHERIHTGDKPYNCEICGKRFSQKANKTKHVKIHKEGAKPHTCELCGRSFSDVEEMNLHRAGHGGGKPRKCNYCEESFRKMSELAQHVRRFHTFERPHKCAFCQKAFYSLYNLKQHVMVHTGQKPYACTRCDLKFTQKGNLTKHFERKHTDKYSTVVEHKSDGDEEIIMSNNNSEGRLNLYVSSPILNLRNRTV